MGSVFRAVRLMTVAMLPCACQSTRYASTLRPTGNSDLSLGSIKFRLASLKLETLGDKWSDCMPEMTRENISQTATRLYPSIFGDEWSALPVDVQINATLQSEDRVMPVICGLLGGIIPFPTRLAGAEFNIGTILRGPGGDPLKGKEILFARKDAAWVSIFGPLGSLPVPGPSDVPRDSFFLGIPISGAPYRTVMVKSPLGERKQQASSVELTSACIVEGIVQSLQGADQASLAEAGRSRSARLQEVRIDGSSYWCYLGPMLATGQRFSDPAEHFGACFYRGLPRPDSAPLEIVVVARRVGGGDWELGHSYLRLAKTLTAVSVSMDHGRPREVVLRTVAEPPLEEFIDVDASPGKEGAANLRWSNAILVQAKNSSLPALLREERRKLVDLVTRIEGAVLMLSDAAERANDRAQRMVEKGEGDPGPDRELAILCRQRIEVFKPILAAIKRELEDRGK